MNRFHIYNNALSEEQIKEFFTKGYFVINSLFSSEEIARIAQNMQEAFRAANKIVQHGKISASVDSTELGKQFRCEYHGHDDQSASILVINNADQSVSIKLISWIGGVKPELLVFGRDERITTPVAQLLMSNKGDHLINQAHYKIPNDQVAFDWHQDIENRRTFDISWHDINGKGSFIQVLTAIDFASDKNGALIVVPGSHQVDLALDKVEPHKREIEIKKKYADLDQIAHSLILQPGDTVFMHPLLLHKSNANNSDSERKMFINGFSYPGANHLPYPGNGSAKEISLSISDELLHLTQEYVTDLLGSLLGSVASITNV